MTDETLIDERTEQQAKRANRRRAFIRDLRACADFLGSHPEIDCPKYVVMNVFVQTREELQRMARVATWEKVYNETWFSLSRTFGEDVKLEINADRSTVCERRVIGTKIVPARPERIVEEVEWVCEKGLLEA